jgi:hypothetical protein
MRSSPNEVKVYSLDDECSVQTLDGGLASPESPLSGIALGGRSAWPFVKNSGGGTTIL